MKTHQEKLINKRNIIVKGCIKNFSVFCKKMDLDYIPTEKETIIKSMFADYCKKYEPDFYNECINYIISFSTNHKVFEDDLEIEKSDKQKDKAYLTLYL